MTLLSVELSDEAVATQAMMRDWKTCFGLYFEMLEENKPLHPDFSQGRT
jgi:hypothetical protein